MSSLADDPATPALAAAPTRLGRAGSIARIVFGTSAMVTMLAVAIVFLLPLTPWPHLRVAFCTRFVQPGFSVLLWIAGQSYEVIGRERLRPGQAIYVANHASIVDILLMIRIMPPGTFGVGKLSLGRLPVIGWAFRLSGSLTFDRARASDAARVTRTAVERMTRYGLSLFMYPEGTRTKDGRLLPFKRGFARIAVATGAPVVPIVIRGAHAAWRTETLSLEPSHVVLEFLEPIDTSNWTLETISAHVDEVRGAFTARLPH